MSEPIKEPEAPPAAPEKPSDSADKPLGEGGEKALKAERERANELDKQLKAATTRLTEIERANESAIEKAMREAQEAKAEVEAVPQKVADQLRTYLKGIHEISDEDAELYLTSSDPEVLLKQAAGISSRKSDNPSTPKPDLTQGAKPAAGSSPEADFASFMQGQLS